jgi:FtsH-binding integral membrane protein
MSRYPQYPQERAAQPWEARDVATDRTVFNFFNVVYAWMAVGLVVTAIVGFVVASSPTMLSAIYGSGPFMIVAIFLGLFGLSWYIQANVGKLSVGTATTLFLIYAAVLGAALSGIFLIYSTATLISSFAVTGGVFGVMSVYGFVTRRDLTAIGSMALMFFVGIFIASIVNVFLANSALSWIITYAVVAIFVVITAYETQMLKNMAMQMQGQPQLASRVAIVGSLMLYISFMNLFLSILRIMGDRR